MADIKLIAFDLDGTLFNSKKEITPATREALELAHSKGIEIVPVTGRFWMAIPENLKSLKFIRYAVTLNGAEVFDVKNLKSLANFNMPPSRAIATLLALSDIDNSICDCVINGQGYMNKNFYEHIGEYMVGPWQSKIVRDLRIPVDDVCELIAEKNQGVQKIQFYTNDKELRENLLKALPVVFPKNSSTSSISNNIEINDATAHKGHGLKFLADYLNLKLKNVMAFGDGLNDVTMIKAAGIGVAMGNACREVLEIADRVTLDCDHDGVAEEIKKCLCS